MRPIPYWHGLWTEVGNETRIGMGCGLRLGMRLVLVWAVD